MMPGMDGFEVCRALKAQPETRDTPPSSSSRRAAKCPTRCRASSSAPSTTSPSRSRPKKCWRASPPTCRASTSSASCVSSRDRLDRELAGAARMQRLILPPAMPAHPSRRASPRTTRRAAMPAATTTTCIPLGADRFGIMVADVSGHGAPAAIVMAMIRAVLHTLSRRARRSAGGAALHQPAFPVSVGHRDVCDRGLRRARCRARVRSACRRRAIRRRC